MRLLVIDGNSIVNRAFYGIKMLSNKQGQFTNGIYGFLNILIKLKAECDPDKVAIAFDLKAPTFRHKLYSEYKAGRKGMPEELRSQMPILKELLSLLGYAVIEKEGFEADDILGTLSAVCAGDDKCFIATGDRDSLQLISDNTTVLLASTKMGKAVTVSYDKAKLLEDYGVEPQGMIEIKALMGDSSDNIPGVAGIGQKTATDLITKYSNIDYIYEHIEELDIKKGVREKLIAGKDSAYLSRTLGTICLDAPVSKNMEDYAIRPCDKTAAIKKLVSLEMFGIIEKLGLTLETATETSDEETKVKTLTAKEERDLPLLLGQIKKLGKVHFVCDFDGDDILSMYFLIGNSVSFVETNCFDFYEFFKDFCAGEWEKYTSDCKILHKAALSRNIDIENLKLDTALAGYVLNPSANSYDILRLAGEYECAAVEIVTESDGIKKDLALQCALLPELSEKLLKEIENNKQEELLFSIEMPLAKVLASMENVGFLVDREGIVSFGENLTKEIELLTNSIYEQAGTEFNINSPKQLGAVLFETLGIPCKKKTKSGYSTNAEVLEELEHDYPIVADVLKYRTLSKLKSTYCEGLLKVIDSDGRIRSTLNQTETRTGRISSTEPNLQNIPIRSELGRQMRKFFVAKDGYVLVDADYSQIELRVLAHVSGDKTMLDAFRNGDDIHTITASQVFNMPVKMVTSLMRSRAKAVNFGIVYGIGAFSLAKDIGVTRKEADSYIKGYLHHYSDVKKYLENVTEKARDDGFVSTLFGRRRYLPELSSSNKMMQAFGERVAKNMPIQGTAADIIKLAMINVFARLKKEKLDANLIMQVHDELIVECKEEIAGTVSAILKEEMENAVTLLVNLTAEVSAGKSWHEAH